MLMTAYQLGFGGGVSPVTIAFVANTEDLTNATVYTFSGASLGTEASNRKIVVSVTSLTSADTVSTLTVGGNSASVVIATSTSGTNEMIAELWQLALAAGTTGDIVVTMTGAGAAHCGIGVWAVYGAAAAAFDTGTSAADPLVDTLNIPGGGVAIGIAASEAVNATFAWTNLTEDFDNLLDSNASESAANDVFNSTKTGLSITANPTGNTLALALSLASWGPA